MKRRTLLALLSILPPLLPAVPMALLPAPVQAQQGQPRQQARQLGRLFNTPQERLQLNARRDENPVEAPPAAAPLPPAPPPAPLQLNGVIQRSNGQATVWVNQAPLPAQDGDVLRDRSVSLRLPSGKRVTLKPGQSYDEATGTIGNGGQ